MEIDESPPPLLADGKDDESKAYPFFDQKTAELHKTLGPCKLTEKQKQSVLIRLEEKSVPGRPKTSIVKGLCRIWTGSKTGEYGQISVSKGKMMLAHRASYEIEHNVALRPEIHVRHLCANTLCNHPDHLALGDAQANADDQVSAGRSLVGEKHYNAKISEETAKKIAEAIKNDWTDSKIADELKCSVYTVNNIRHGRAWSSVTGIKKHSKPKTAAKKLGLQPEHEAEAKAYVEKNSKKIKVGKKEHWIWELKGRDRGGYGRAKFKSKNYLAHNFAWRAFNGCLQVPKGMQVHHGCKFKDCVSPGCLTVGDAKKNAADKIRDGTHHRGVKNPNAKFTEEQVLEIRSKRAKGAPLAALAGNYRVSIQTISDVVNRTRYKDI